MTSVWTCHCPTCEEARQRETEAKLAEAKDIIQTLLDNGCFYMGNRIVDRAFDFLKK